jgi:hypothetical protein
MVHILCQQIRKEENLVRQNKTRINACINWFWHDCKNHRNEEQFFLHKYSKCSDFAFLNIEKRTLTEQAAVLKCKIMK